MKEMLICFLLCLVIGSILNSASTTSNTREQLTGSISSSPASSALATSDATFEKDVLAAKLPVLVDFWASWCGPCQQMAPVVEYLADSYKDKLKVVKVDTDANPAISKKYKIVALPTFMIFKNGKEVASVTGSMSQEELASVIEEHI